MHPEMEPNYSKQRLIFRPKSLLLGWWGGMHPPHPPLNPPLAPALYTNRHCTSLLRQVDKSVTVIKRMGKFDWCAVIEKQWCNLWKRQNVQSLHFDYQPKTYCFGIDIRLLFLVSIARTTGINMSVERQRIAN